MKGPSRRRGNQHDPHEPVASHVRLNEGPLQKEGQYELADPAIRLHLASMKGPSRRRGNPLCGQKTISP